MIASFVLTPEQGEALDRIARWYASDSREPFVLSGLAGTGKTATLPMLYDVLPPGTQIRSVAPTWKAAANLTRRLTVAPGSPRATSIHALIYTPTGVKHVENCAVWDAGGNFDSAVECDSGCSDLRFEFTPHELGWDLVIVDEASMLDQWVRADLMALNTKILMVGDEGQLPPIRGQNIFSERAPDFTLTKIMRQAADNPVIALAWDIRTGAPGVASWVAAASRRGFDVHSRANPYDLRSADAEHRDGRAVILAYRNKTVDRLNRTVRSFHGRRGPGLEVGDTVQLRDNDRKRGFFNGESGTVVGLGSTDDYGGTAAQIEIHGRTFDGRVAVADSGLTDVTRRHGLMRVTFGYASTVHRFQGSEAPVIGVLLDSDRVDRRWAYTAVTRSSNRLWLRTG